MMTTSTVRIPTIKVSILILISIALVCSILFWSRFQIGTLKDIDTLPIVVASNELNRDISNTLDYLSFCLESNSCTQTASKTDDIVTSLSNFEFAAATDKKHLSLVGSVEYTRLLLSIKKFNSIPSPSSADKLQLFIDLSKLLLVIDKNNDRLMRTQIEAYVSERDKKLYMIINIIGILSLLLLTITLLALVRNRKGDQRNVTLTKRIERLAEDVRTEDVTHIETRLATVDLDNSERTIFSSILKSYKARDALDTNADLYRHLYGLIGYEIRGLTNTIKGGVNFLVQDTDNESIAMARDITSATKTLSDLAENYNQLISNTNSSGNKNFSFPTLISELAILVSTKTQRSQQKFECKLSHTLPNIVIGNATSLFWVLFLQISNAIKIRENKNILMVVDSTEQSEVEWTKTNIDVYFLTGFDNSLNKIQSLFWSEESKENSENWSKTILTDFKGFGLKWFSSGKQEKLNIEFMQKTSSFCKMDHSLENTKFLICGGSVLKTNILADMLTAHDAGVDIIDKPNDILSRIKAEDDFDYDAVLIGDDLAGIRIKPYSKILSTMLKKGGKIKLFASVGTTQTAQELNDIVDNTFFAPHIEHEFIPALSEALSEPSEEVSENQMEILIVEDDKVQQFLLKQILMKNELEAKTVNNGAEAVEYVENHNCEIIFMDCIMPGMGGIEATRIIRRYERESKQKRPCTIIGATALTSSSEHKACIDAGMDFVISKPYKKDEILKAIKKYAAIHKLA
ncbi:ATP-binding response regulator [Vibrio comitans]|uniref:Response regulatory domain-containing protein n=1 Tax=Vibrio comitans NBRC 102076 TaxID=1219078 RepID=A0A4Y3IQX4_9VIBR|nr:response regulator [Vibrio comitans]GEA61939.1 hypothetical protein VCO01S_31320 [Vibrio comitans NBRC 102076]